MQLNNHKTSTSNLIKQSNMAKKKSRRKLIGSIFMLLTALIILLNVTTKEKPIPIKAQVIEISSNAQNQVKTNSSAPNIQLAASAPVTASSPIKNTAGTALETVNTASAPQGDGFRAGVLNRNNQKPVAPEATLTPLTDVTAPQANETITPHPKIINQIVGNRPPPEDILNGNADSSPSTLYFVQIAASQNKTGLQELQKTLANQGIKSSIQKAKNNMYRLKAGPFANKDDADQSLAEIQDNLDK